MSYYELWAILSSWRNEFSSEEFRRTFASPDPRKVLYDMTKKGFLERKGYGKYRVKPVDDYVKSKNDVSSAYELLNASNLPYALTDADGVLVWTRGGYNAGRFFGSYPIYLKVLKSDIEEWKDFLASNGRKWMLKGTKPSETLYGAYYVLYPERRIEAETVEGLKVEPLNRTIKFAKKNIYTYEPALEMLDEEYGLGLRTKYSK